MKRHLPWLVAFLLVVAAGAVHGWRTDRWSLSDEPAASAAKLDGLPMELGGWIATKEEQMDGEQQALAEIAGYKLRTYSKGGQKVRVLIACGRPGPLSVHTPDICMGGAGYTSEGDQRKVIELKDGSSAEMNVGRFAREAGPAGPVQQRIFWAWSADGNWSTPAKPRLTFFRSPALFKIYVTRDLTRSDKTLVDDNDPCLDLIRCLLNELHDRLAPAS